ncbi:MAG TPA: prepilin-type N-terminal cleavage/methylation domain-containing protein [Planctomycetes bacterium]|nr:prepilin-type N-terminal cleavage/methylation domain-containing protein [Planctomycetota bacterium]HIJ70489.1 prepilin-type N-terminal cleavage/methylation domain-containing protein [Planctomycetota bacterium]
MVTADSRKGFSLIEMIVAAVLLSGAVVTICAIGNRSLGGVKLNRENETAWQLLDRQLALIDYIGVEQFMEAGQTEGSFGDDDEGGTVYYWSSNITEGEADNIYRVDMLVSWSAGGRAGQVSAATVFNGTGSTQLSSDSGESAPSSDNREGEGGSGTR